MHVQHEGTTYNINLVDTPGHIDFSSEVSAAIRITDGAVVLVDSIEGVSAQTTTVLRQALAEKLTPILVINKIDRYFYELKLTGEEAYSRLRSIIAQVNEMIELYQPDCPTKLDPQIGNVLFTCARYNWGFSIKTFSEMFAKKSGKPYEQYMKILWGDMFVNPETKKISNSPAGGIRGFDYFIYTPMQNAINAMFDNDKNMDMILEKAFITLTPAEKKAVPGSNTEIRKVLRKSYPLGPMLVETIVKFMPTPYEAQQRKVSVLYTGPPDHPTYKSIETCDPDGELVIYISKMIPTGVGGTFYSFGRVFSGTVRPGQRVSILGANYEPGSKTDCFDNKSIQGVIKLVGAKTERVEEMKCGNTVALIGISEYLMKSGTVTTCPSKYPIRTMKFSVSPVVRIAIAPKNMAEIGKFNEGVVRLSKSDPCLKVELSESGDTIIGVSGALHGEIAVNDLRDFLGGLEIVVSEPVVPYRETVTALSPVCLSKSPNKHNRLYCTAEPLPEDIVKDLESGEYTLRDQQKLTRRLVDVYGWEKSTTTKVWAMENGNMLIDATRGVDYMLEIKDSVVAGFSMFVNAGVMCEEPVRGVLFKLVDVNLHSDSIHRGNGQILVTARRVFCAACLLGAPRLMEPLYNVTIQVDDENKNKIFGVMSRKRGFVTGTEQIAGLPLWNVTGLLPVAESFDFDAVMKEATSGKGLPSCLFSHYEIIESDPLVKGDDPTKKDANAIALEIIKRKTKGDANRSLEIPTVDKFLDKL